MREWALRLDGAEPAPRGGDEVPAEAVLALAGAVRRWHARAAAGGRDARGRRPGVRLERRWVPVASVGIYVPRGLVSTLVMCAVPALEAGVEEIVVVTPPRGAGPVAAAAQAPRTRPAARARRPAGDRLGYGTVRSGGWRRSSGPGSAPVNEAKLLVSRDVPIDLPAGPSEVVVLAGRGADRDVAALELAAQAEHGPASSASRRGRRRPRGALAGWRRSRPSTSSSSARPRRSRPGAKRRRGLRRGFLAGRCRRLRDRREPRPSHRRLGARGRRARARDLPQAGDRPAGDARTGSSASARWSRRSRRSRACPRTPYGGAAVRALPPSSGRTGGRRRRPRSRARQSSTPRRSSASTATSRRYRARRPGRARSRRPSRA